MSDSSSSVVKCKVAIIGSGFAGLIMAKTLMDNLETNFVILEKDGGLGGTWTENTYPGCACDVPSHLYSLKSQPCYDWSRVFAPREEIQDYIRSCYDKFNLGDKLEFNSRVDGIEWKELEQYWEISVNQNLKYFADYVVMGTGPLNVAKFPSISGKDDFKAEHFHSSKWPRDFNYRGKNIAVVGTGASAIQIVPALASKVKSVHLFQRTAPWVIPKNDRPYSHLEKKLFKMMPFLIKASRYRHYLFREFILGAYMGNKWLHKWLERKAKNLLNKSISDPELRKKLLPNYKLGCKRLLLSNDYYKALDQENVFLHTESISKINSSEIFFGDKHIKPDAIIYATGFHPSAAAAKVNIKGRPIKTLMRQWLREGPQAFKGIMAHGFPGLFFMLGPNTGLANNSILLMMEAQAKFICRTVKNFDAMDQTPDISLEHQVNYVEDLQKNISNSIWNQGGCQSWYLDNRGNNWSLWPGSVSAYEQELEKDFSQALIVSGGLS